MTETLTPEFLLRAYAQGLFPMAETRDGAEIYLLDPEERGILPLNSFHVPRRLRRLVRSDPFRITVNAAFAQVIEGCRTAAPTGGRDDSWINDDIVRAYTALHQSGGAHSVECWREDRLAGGVYGVALRGAFFGESMFSAETGGSKLALVHLVALLKSAGYRLFDAQFVNAHLKQFGIVAAPRARFRKMLDDALAHDAVFPSQAAVMSGKAALAQIDADA